MANRTWWQGRAATLSWLVALVAGLLVAAAYPAAASGGSKTPAIAVAPHYKVVGKADPGVPPTFNCQVSTRPTCYGPAQIRAAYGIDKVNATGAGPHDRHRRRVPEPDHPARPRPVRPDLRAARGDGRTSSRRTA